MVAGLQLTYTRRRAPQPASQASSCRDMPCRPGSVRTGAAQVMRCACCHETLWYTALSVQWNIDKVCKVVGTYHMLAQLVPLLDASCWLGRALNCDDNIRRLKRCHAGGSSRHPPVQVSLLEYRVADANAGGVGLRIGDSSTRHL
jgi:hypothetical protein